MHKNNKLGTILLLFFTIAYIIFLLVTSPYFLPYIQKGSVYHLVLGRIYIINTLLSIEIGLIASIFMRYSYVLGMFSMLILTLGIFWKIPPTLELLIFIIFWVILLIYERKQSTSKLEKSRQDSNKI